MKSSYNTDLESSEQEIEAKLESFQYIYFLNILNKMESEFLDTFQY